MFKKVFFFALVCVVASQAWTLSYPNSGQLVIGTHYEIKNGGNDDFYVFFLTDNTFINVHDIDQPDTKQIFEQLKNAYLTGQRIRFARNYARNSVTGNWYRLSDWTNVSVTSYDIYSGDNAMIRFVP